MEGISFELACIFGVLVFIGIQLSHIADRMK